MKLILIFGLILPSYALGSVSVATRWDVRTTGTTNNSGGFDSTAGTCGTDFSKQNAAQITYIDLTIGTPNTTYTSALNPVGATIVCNVVRITGGSGCTTGFYLITSQAAAVATVTGALGTIGSTCTATIGGSLPTIADLVLAQTFQAANTAQAVACIKSGTYTQTTTIQLNSSPWTAWIGYGTTCGDNGTAPLITTATNSTVLFTANNSGVYGGQTFQNINFSNTAGTRAAGFDSAAVRTSVQLIGCIMDGFSSAFSTSSATSWTFLGILNSEIKNSTGIAVDFGANGSTGLEQMVIQNSWIHDSGSHAIKASNGVTHIERSIISANTGSGLIDGAVAPKVVYLDSNAFRSNGASGVAIAAMAGSGTGGQVTFANRNNIYYGNVVNGISMPVDIVTTAGPNWYNAYGANGTDRVNVPAGTGDVTLTADPFTSATNFALNHTTGGGAALRGLGYPGTFAGGASVGALDIGPVQSGSGGVSSAFATAQ